MKIKIEALDVLGMAKIAKKEGYTHEEFILATVNPVEFNNGCCVSFAEHFAPKIDGAMIEDSTDHFNSIKEYIPTYKHGSNYHQFINIKGRFYDYEALDGVSKVIDLPFFKRLKTNPVTW